jgi:hypothetical protein
LVAKELDFRHAFYETPENVCILLPISRNNLVYRFLHGQIAQQHFTAPNSIELLIIGEGFPVVSSDRVDGCVEEGEEQGELVHHAEESDVAGLLRQFGRGKG